METERWEKVAELFEASVELSGEERRRFLEERCNGDDGLVQDVLALIGADERPGAYMEPPNHTEIRQVTSRAAVEHLSGTRIGPYRLERVIGRGGMGAVYLARRADGDFEQEVAIKLIRRGMDTDDILRRFQNERQVLANLTHPGIARLLDGGATEDGRPYLVMEVVDGVPIDRYCETRKLDLAARLRLFLRVCDAIGHAHEQRVVHRDLKPSNILVTSDGQPKLLDFGISKLLDATGSIRTTDVTATELRLMTPEYASPEQVRGKKIDARSDVYALGVILYELLTSRRPYDITTGLRSDLERAICEEDPTRPSRRMDSRRMRARLAGDLDTIVMTALRKEPERRYSSVRELARDVENHLEGKRVLARPATWRYRTAKFVRRNRTLVASALAVFMVLVAGLIGTLSMFLEAESERKEGLEREYIARIAAAAGAITSEDAAAAQRYLESTPAELRDWEWWHLAGRADRSELQLRGHDGRVVTFKTSPDGRRIVSGGRDSFLTVHDLDTGREVHRFDIDDRDTNMLSLTPDGAQALVQSDRDRVRLWDIESGELLREYAGAPYRPTSLTEIRDGTFATGGESGVVLLIDLATGGQLKRIESGDTAITNVSFRNGTAQIVAGHYDGIVNLLDVESGLVLRQIVVPDMPGIVKGNVFEGVRGMALDPGEDRVAVLGEEGYAFVWNLDTGEELLRVRAQTVSGVSIGWSLDGARIATGGRDCVVRVWDVTTGERTAVLLGHRQPVNRVCFLPDGEHLASSSTDGTVRVWSVLADDVVRLDEPTMIPVEFAITRDARILSVGSEPDSQALLRVTLLDLQTGETLATWSDERRRGRASIALDPDEEVVAVTTNEGFVLLDPGTLEPKVRVATVEDVDHLAFLNGQELFVFDEKRVRIWSLENEGYSSETDHPWGSVHSFVFGPERRQFATGHRDRAAVWDAGSLRPFRELEHEGTVQGMDWSRDGRLFATASSSKTVHLWDAQTGRRLHRFEDRSPIWDVAFTLDGKRLAVAPHDRTIRLWDTGRGIEICTLRGHESGVRALAFTEDGRSLISKARYGGIRVWDSLAPDGPGPAAAPGTEADL